MKFNDAGVSTFYELGLRIDYTNHGDQWIDLLWRLYNSSAGAMMPTDVKPTQFMQLRGAWHPTDLDDYFVCPRRSPFSLLYTCALFLKKLIKAPGTTPMGCATRVMEHGASGGSPLEMVPMKYDGKHACSGCRYSTAGPCKVEFSSGAICSLGVLTDRNTIYCQFGKRCG